VPLQSIPLGEPARVQFSPHGTWVLALGRSHYQLWDWQHARRGPAWPLGAIGAETGAAAFGPMHPWIATLHAQDTLQLRPLPDEAFPTTLAPRFTLQPPSVLGCVAIGLHPAQTHLYALGRPHRLYVWRLDTLEAALAEISQQ
jgi:hypothetical protein